MSRVSKSTFARRGNQSKLALKIGVLCLSIALVISVVLTTVNLLNLSDIKDKNLETVTELTMRYLNSDIQNAILPALNMTSTLAALIPEIDSLDEMERILMHLSPTVETSVEMYYGTILSRSEGGSFNSSFGSEYYSDPGWDHTKRPWFMLAMQNPDKILISDPYQSAAGSTCVAMTKTVRDNVSNRDDTPGGGKIIGVAGIDVFLDKLTEIVALRKITGDGT